MLLVMLCLATIPFPSHADTDHSSRIDHVVLVTSGDTAFYRNIASSVIENLMEKCEAEKECNASGLQFSTHLYSELETQNWKHYTLDPELPSGGVLLFSV